MHSPGRQHAQHQDGPTARTLANLRVAGSCSCHLACSSHSDHVPSDHGDADAHHSSPHDGPHPPPCPHEHQPHLGDMVPASAVIRRTAHHLHQALTLLATAAAPPSRHHNQQQLLHQHQQFPHHYASSDKIRRDLIGLVQLAHRLLAKLAAGLSWAQHVSSAYVLSQSLWAHVQRVDVALKQSLDKMRHLNLLIAAAKHANRNPDVPTAAVVLSTGCYPFLPSPEAVFPVARGAHHHAPQHIWQHSRLDKDVDPHDPDDIDPVLIDHLNDAIRSRLILHECTVPPVFMAHHHIDGGLVSFSVPNEFAVTLSLPGGFDPTIPWTLVTLDLLDPSIFQHFDSERRTKVHEHLQERDRPWPARTTPPSTPPNLPSPFDLPLIELYHMLHHIFLSMRLEALYFQAGTRDRSSGALAAIGDPEFDLASKSMHIRLWWGTFNAQSIFISTTTAAQELLFNASQHSSLSPVPLLSTTPTLCAVGAKKATSSTLHFQSTNLVMQFGPLRISIPPRISLESLVTWCMSDYAPSALVTQNRLAGDHIILPDHGLAIAIHRTTGQFSVVPLDRFHTDLKLVLDMLNKAPWALPEILHALTMSQRLGNLEASLSFDGLEPCPQDTPLTPNNRIVIDGLDLGPIRLARVLQLPYDPEYRLYLSMETFPTTKAFIVRWGPEEKRIIHEFFYGPACTSWNGAWLKIDPSAILLRPAIQLMVSFMSVTVHVNSRLPLTLTILFSRSIPGLSSALLTKSCPSVSELINYTFKCFGLVSLLAFLPTAATSIGRANFDSCTIDLNLPTGDSVTLQPTDPLVIKTPSSTALPGVRFPPFESTNPHIALPEHPESCLVVQGPKSPQGRDVAVSLVFAIPSPRVVSGPEYVPLVYSWSGSVVSPWDSKDGFEGSDDDDMIMNPSAVLAMLGMGDANSSPKGSDEASAATNGSGSMHELKPTVHELLAEIKGESITQSTSEDSLLWSLTRLIQRWRGT
ncbi:hypothetical protein BCR44DRAFT_1518683 [Catenaria anguillulae PL171]|uniref:Mediator of RNA polymerase II transcription subunit 14 n=1 Tax=Catenaria anguillulae PL171 TaxID=765915 RepID=A0A1Y2H4S4_9FUNG|nr:hypothetical protein BCR44DRAFT_1518683 [Catenaria anguillulae PL171]